MYNAAIYLQYFIFDIRICLQYCNNVLRNITIFQNNFAVIFYVVRVTFIKMNILQKNVSSTTQSCTKVATTLLQRYMLQRCCKISAILLHWICCLTKASNIKENNANNILEKHWKKSSMLYSTMRLKINVNSHYILFYLF